MKNKKFMKRLLSTVTSLALAVVMVVGFAFAPATQVSAAAAPGNAASFGKQAPTVDVKDASEFSAKTQVAKTADYKFGGVATYSSDPIQISSTPKNIPITDYEETYVYFTTAAASDYTLEFTAFSAYIHIYDAETGDFINIRDTEWYSGDSYRWQQREVMTFALEANTTYLFEIYPYEPSVNTNNPSTVQMAVYKVSAEDSVENIEIVQPSGKMDCYNILDKSDFNYKVTFGDNTGATVSYEALCAQGGYDVNFDDCGTYISFNNEYIMRAIDTPVFVEYKGNYSSAMVSYTSVTDNLKNNGAGIFDVDQYYNTIYESDGNGDNEALRVMVNQTGYYYWTPYGSYDIEDKLYGWNAVFIDEQNNIVKFDEKTSTWPLVAGREYAFFLWREFNYGAYSYSYRFKKDVDTIYPDTSKSGWYHDSVTYVTGRGIMSGYSNGKFGTSDGIQRQDFLVMLARLANVDLDIYKYESDFPDVARGSYYEAAVNWGADYGIVTGYNNGKFGVGDKITREQIVTFLYRYAENWCGRDTSVSSSAAINASRYSDYRIVSGFAKEPMLWALENGVLSGKTANTIVPHGNAQRCEVAKIMYNIFINDVF